ncbi:MAG: glycosyltransferase family 4 protein [Acidobacteriota bacterium]
MSGRPTVCHVITRLELGGAQQNTLYTCAHLDRQRFAVQLVSGPGGLLDDEARRLPDVTYEQCPALHREVRPGRDVRAYRDLVRRLRRLAPEIVHTHSSKAGILGRLAARRAGVPVIVHSVHGWGFTPTQPWPVRRAFVLAERLVARVTDRFIAVSRANVERGVAEGIAPRDRFTVIRSGIEIGRFRRAADSGEGEALRCEIGVPQDAPLAGMVACLKPQKAPVDFVRLAARVASDVPDARFLLAGDGVLRGEVERAVREAGLGGRLHLLGWRRDTERVIAACDVLVLTSRHEGLPRVVPEAMAAGRPVVATAVDGTPEAVSPGETGFLREPGDVDGLAADVARLLRDPALRARLGAAARARVAEWDIDAMVRAQERLYGEMLACPARPAAPAPAAGRAGPGL